MSETCPRCKGKGKIETPAFSRDITSVTRRCHICLGRGTLDAEIATLSPEAIAYFTEALDLTWGYDGDYSHTFAELENAWRLQNELRHSLGIVELTDMDLQRSRKGKP